MTTAAPDLFGDINVVDADTHLTEPHDLWTSRAPREWDDRVPHVREVDGRPMWTFDGDVFGNADRCRGDPARRLEGRSAPSSCGSGSTTCTPARTTVEPRLEMMDELGIHAQIVYPNVVGFGGQRFATSSIPSSSCCARPSSTTRWPRSRTESGEPPVPDGDPAVVGHRRRGAPRSRGRTRSGLRGVNTNADPHNEGFPDLAEPALGPAVGGVRRPRRCR